MRATLLGTSAFLFSSGAWAQAAPVSYDVSFPNAAHHEAEISVTFREIGDGPLTVRMSRASPGRYALHEFAKNVYGLSAVDAAGQALSVSQDDPYSWAIEGHGGEATVTYTLYADRADGTYSQIDLTHAHLNMPATLIWAVGLEDRPVEISFEPASPDWEAATQLVPAGSALVFTAPDLQYLMDSPTELSKFDLREWTIGEGESEQTIRLAIHHEGTPEDADAYAKMAKNVIDAQIELFGEAPRFDYGTYTFIADYLPYVSGDGMEHRNSTVISNTKSLYESEFAQLGTLSHEFIHAWNVERLRPAELEPFDFTKANPTTTLWFAEGFTTYYAPLTILRAGEQELDDYLKTLSRNLSYVVNGAGRELRSPMAMSLRAPFVDAATAIDPDNNANTFVSYYPYGAMIGLALDLELRRRFDGVSLDDYMRRLWQKFGKTETPYTHDDLLQTLAEVTGDAAFAERFFDSYIETGALPDFGPLLAQAGLELGLANPDKAWLGGSFEADGPVVKIASNTVRGTPLYEAGLGRGDEITRIGRFDINSTGDIDTALSRHKPGDSVDIAYVSRAGKGTASVTLGEDPELKVTSKDELSADEKDFREDWLGVEETDDAG